jgi:hypothetical protein
MGPRAMGSPDGIMKNEKIVNAHEILRLREYVC